MARAVMNSLSTVEIVFLFVGGSIVLAISVAIFIRRLVPDIAERQFEELASGLRVVYELMFALILAFAIASVIDKFSNAESTVATESTALSQLLRDNRAFPPDLQSRLRDGIGGYVESVVGDEWKAMRVGQASREASAALDTVYALYQGYQPASGVAEQFYQQALAHLDTVASARRERLGISTARLPLILVLMLPVGALLLVLLEYRPMLGTRGQAAFMGTFALVLSSTYLLTILLDYPFSGDVSVSSAPLRSGTLAYLAITPPRQLQPGDTPLKLTPQALVGIWSSDAYGTVALQREGGEVHGTYRGAQGVVRGVVGADGVFRGTWCEGSKRVERRDAGLLEWHLIRRKSGEEMVTGRWRFGYGPLPDGNTDAYIGWDMRRLKTDKAQDLEDRLRNEPESAYCHAP